MQFATAPNFKYASYWVKYILPFLSKKDKVLDIGAGRGDIAWFLNKKHKIKTIALDINRPSIPVGGIKIFVYDGKRIPFNDNFFDASILRAVLHHCKDPESVLLEAKRVTKKNIFVFEDIYKGNWEKYSTFIADSLVNFGSGPLDNTIFHPRNNKTFKGWLKTFKKLGLKVKHSEKWQTPIGRLIPFRWHFAFFVLSK